MANKSREVSPPYRPLEISIWKDTRKYDAVSFLLLALEVFPQENIEFWDIIPQSFKWLTRYTEIEKQKWNLSSPLFKEQIELHNSLAKLSYRLKEVESFFSDKSPWFVRIQSLIRYYAQSPEGLKQSDIESLSFQIEEYKHLYDTFRLVDQQKSVLWWNLSKLIEDSLYEMFQKSEIPQWDVMRFSDSIQKYGKLFATLSPYIYNSSDIVGTIGPFETSKRWTEPYKTFFHFVSVYYTQYIVGQSSLKNVYLFSDMWQKIEQTHKNGLYITTEVFQKLVVEKAFQDLKEIFPNFQLDSDIDFTLQDGTLRVKQPVKNTHTDTPNTVQEKDAWPQVANEVLFESFFSHKDFPRKVSKSVPSSHPKFWEEKTFEELTDLVIQKMLAWEISSNVFYEKCQSYIIPWLSSSLLFIETFYKRGIFSWEQCLYLLEPQSWFQRPGISLTDCLKKFGISWTFKNSLSFVVWKELQDIELQRIQVLLEYTLFMESSWGYNVANYEWESSAEWYFQYLRANGRKWQEILNPKTEKYEVYNPKNKSHISWLKEDPELLRTIRKLSSFDTWLSAIPESIRKNFPDIDKNFKSIGSPKKQSVFSLNASEQMILFFSDMMKKDSATMNDIIFKGNIQKIPSLYANSHHTNPDKATQSKMKVAQASILTNSNL